MTVVAVVIKIINIVAELATTIQYVHAVLREKKIKHTNKQTNKQRKQNNWQQ